MLFLCSSLCLSLPLPPVHGIAHHTSMVCFVTCIASQSGDKTLRKRTLMGQQGNITASYRHGTDGEPGMCLHPVSQGRVCPLSTTLAYDSTAQRCPWPRQPGPSTSSLLCVPQTPPNTVQKTQTSPLSLVSPRPSRCLQSSCTSILLVAPAAEPLHNVALTFV